MSASEKSFVVIMFLNEKPHLFIRRDFNYSSLATNFCVYDSESDAQQVRDSARSYEVRSRFVSYEVPQNYSVLGKTPLQFLKECFQYVPLVQKVNYIEKGVRSYARKKTQKNTSFEVQSGLFDDLGENRNANTEKSPNPTNYDFDIF